VINKNLDSAYTATINLHGFVSNDTMEIWDITNDTILAAPWNGTKGIIYRGKYSGDSTTFTYTFPKASVTALLIASKSMGIEENTSCKVENIRLEAYPNPVNSSCAITVSYSAGVAGNSVSTEGKQRNEMTLKVYDLRGNVVWEWSPDRDNRHREMSPISRTFIWQPDKTSASGIYLIRATMHDGQTITKRIVYLK
ncbi:T9SS type A sorting domain-containing protein, partial [bacterium]|nr:T9SS type A sorting domain-containing protein [bacterium]